MVAIKGNDGLSTEQADRQATRITEHTQQHNLANGSSRLISLSLRQSHTAKAGIQASQKRQDTFVVKLGVRVQRIQFSSSRGKRQIVIEIEIALRCDTATEEREQCGLLALSLSLSFLWKTKGERK